METDFEERSSLDSIIDYAQTLWRWLWLLLLVAIAAGAIAYYFTDRQPRVYEASTKAMVNVVSGSNTNDAYTAIYTGPKLADTYAQTMITEALLAAVAERLGYPVTGEVTAVAGENSPIFTVTVKDDDPQKAADTANAVVSVFSEKVRSDQLSRYAELKKSLENEIAVIDAELTTINESLAELEIKDAEFEAARERAAKLEAQGLEAPEVTRDPQLSLIHI